MTAPSEGFDETQEGPARHGRRDPQLAAMLDADDMAADHSDQDPTEYGLVAGDIIMAKVTLAGPTELGDGWYTYGVQSRLIDGETEAEAFNRVATITNGRVLNLAEDAFNRVADLVEEQREAARTHRIPSQRG
jgi:hypothetical protein